MSELVFLVKRDSRPSILPIMRLLRWACSCVCLIIGTQLFFFSSGSSKSSFLFMDIGLMLGMELCEDRTAVEHRASNECLARILNFFYKNIVPVGVLWWFQIYDGWSANL